MYPSKGLETRAIQVTRVAVYEETRRRAEPQWRMSVGEGPRGLSIGPHP
jgi:hypothetical protein